MKQIAIYDLDKTILTKPTFTAFLIFAARNDGKALWWRAPIWISALIGYKLKLYGRKPMKQFGLRLFVGEVIRSELAIKFASTVAPSDVQHGAAAAILRDRAEGKTLVIATASPEFYASEIGKLLQFDAVIATKHRRSGTGGFLNQFDGENCYGTEKLTRVQAWMAENGLDRKDCHIRFYSDHPSDAPVFDFSDEPILVGDDAKMQVLAARKDWKMVSFKDKMNG
jgi:phosphatidylglycerophosphatase C